MGNNIQTLLTAIKSLEQELFKRKTIRTANGRVIDTNKGYTLLHTHVFPDNKGFTFLLRTFDASANDDTACKSNLIELVMRDGIVYDEAEWKRITMKGIAWYDERRKACF